MAGDNMSLGRFRLEGLPPAPRGVPQVEVTFDIDANGILNVTARDKATGKEQKVTITASTNLNKDDIDRMVREAGQHQAEDARRKELADLRNTGDNLAYQSERTLRDLGDRVPQAAREDIQNKIEEVRQAIKTDDSGRIRRAIDDLQNAANALSAQAAAQAQSQPGDQGPQGQPYGQGENEGKNQGGTGEGDVIEGEFRET